MITFNPSTWDENIRYEYPLGPDSIVFDVGANEGLFAKRFNDKYGCQVFCYEPIKEYANALIAKFNGNPKISVVAQGISDSSKSCLMCVYGQSSSVFVSPKEAVPKVTCDFVQLRTAMDAAGVKDIDLLKINIEGGEYEVLEDIMRTGIADRIKFIQVQCHEFEGAYSPKRLEDIRAELSKTHECTWRWEPMVWESWTLKTTGEHHAD